MFNITRINVVTVEKSSPWVHWQLFNLILLSTLKKGGKYLNRNRNIRITSCHLPFSSKIPATHLYCISTKCIHNRFPHFTSVMLEVDREFFWQIFLFRKKVIKDRSSHQRCFIIKGVLRNFVKFTGKHFNLSKKN